MLFCFEILKDPLQLKKKKNSLHWVHGTQNNRLELKVSKQKSVLENVHIPKILQIWFGWCPESGHISANILGLGSYFSKPIFALKPLVQACHFEYHEPHKLNQKTFEL